MSVSQKGTMPKTIADPQSLTEEDVWREVVRIFIDIALVGSNKGVDDDELNYYLDPNTKNRITWETVLMHHSMEDRDGNKYEADSLDVLEAINVIEEAFDLSLPLDDVEGAENAGDVLAIVLAAIKVKYGA